MLGIMDVQTQVYDGKLDLFKTVPGRVNQRRHDNPDYAAMLGIMD